MSASETSVRAVGARAPMKARTRPNLTEGPITWNLLKFSVPLLLGTGLQTLNLSVNQFWVAHSLGETAITAIGNSNLIMMLLMGSIMGLAMIANVLVGQAVGRGDLQMVKRVVGTAVGFFAVFATLLAAAGMTWAPNILNWMGTPPAARAEAVIYLRTVFFAMPFMYFFNFLQQAQRGAGDSRTPFYFLALAVVIDITLNPMLIRGIGPFPQLGIAGSAISTLCGQGVGLVALIAYLYRTDSPLTLGRGDLGLLKPDLSILRSLITRGLPSSAQMIFAQGAAIMMISMVNAYGEMTAAAYTAASQVWTYVQMPAIAMSSAATAMAAQNIGAGAWHRVNEVARSAILLSLALGSVIAAAIYLSGDLVLKIFLPEGSPAIPIAQHINYFALWGFVLYGVTFQLIGIVRANGSTIPPMVVLVISMWAVRVVFAKATLPYLGEDAIWISFPLGVIASITLNGLYFRYGPWRKAKMLHHVSPAAETADTGLELGAPLAAAAVEEAVDEAAELRPAAPRSGLAPRPAG